MKTSSSDGGTREHGIEGDGGGGERRFHRGGKEAGGPASRDGPDRRRGRRRRRGTPAGGPRRPSSGPRPGSPEAPPGRGSAPPPATPPREASPGEGVRRGGTARPHRGRRWRRRSSRPPRGDGGGSARNRAGRRGRRRWWARPEGGPGACGSRAQPEPQFLLHPAGEVAREAALEGPQAAEGEQPVDARAARSRRGRRRGRRRSGCSRATVRSAYRPKRWLMYPIRPWTSAASRTTEWPSDPGVAAGRVEDRREKPHRRCLAGAVRAHQAEDLPALDGEGEAVDGGRPAEAPGEPLGADGVHGRPAPDPRPTAPGSGHPPACRASAPSRGAKP